MQPGCKAGGDGMALMAPCKGCTDRTTGDRATDCHTTCERYAEFLAQRAKIRKARMEYMAANVVAIEGHRRLKECPPTGGNKRPWHR